MANPNIVATTLIYGRTDVLNVTSTPTAITSNPAGSSKVYKINTLTIANVAGGSPIDIDVDLYRSGTAYFIAKTVSIPDDSSLAVIAKENPIYLNEGDSLRITAGGSSQAVAVCSYEEIG